MAGLIHAASMARSGGESKRDGTPKKRDKKPHVSGKRRTQEQKQEKKSRHQLALCWEDWPLQSTAEDLGEDLFFQLYADGNFTGLSFYVQLKSTTDIDSRSPKKSPDVISYGFDTKDLLHWEDSATPVILVVWDVVKEIGYWQDVPSALKALDRGGKAWRKQKTAAVRIPKTQGTDASGRESLRLTLAHLAYPMLSKGKQVVITPTFRFPNNPKGQALAAAVQKTIDEGGTMTIDREYIEKFRASAWYERAFGVRTPQSITISSGGEPVSFSLQVQAVGAERTEALSVEVRRTIGGMKKTTFASTHQTGPVDLTMVMGPQELEMSLTFNHPCKTVYDSLALTKFLIAVEQGASVQVALPDGGVIGKQESLRPKGGRTLPELQRWEALLVKLSYIQSRVARFGSFAVDSLSDSDISTIERLWTILKTGEYRAVMQFSMMATSGPKFPGKEGPLSIQINPFGEEVLLGVTIPLGEVHCDFVDSPAAIEAIERVDFSSGEPQEIKLDSMQVVRRYVDWIGSKDGPENVPHPIDVPVLQAPPSSS